VALSQLLIAVPKNHLISKKAPFFIYQASPGLEGGQVAVLRLHAASTGHVTKAAYSYVREMYVL
jgi:hypothetical protein